jgi:hypothetical protein
MIKTVFSHRPIIPALGRLRQEDQEFEASMGCVAIPCLKKKIIFSETET